MFPKAISRSQELSSMIIFLSSKLHSINLLQLGTGLKRLKMLYNTSSLKLSVLTDDNENMQLVE